MYLSDARAPYPGIDVPADLEAAAVADLLDCQVALGPVDLFVQRDRFACIGQRHAEQLRQVFEHALGARRVDLDTLTRAEVQSWKPGETLLLNGRMLTGRDAAHKRIADLFASGQGLPEGVDFRNRAVYYVGPVDPVRDEVVGPAGPTTATAFATLTLEHSLYRR